MPIRLVRRIEIVAATLLVVATAVAFHVHRDVVFVHVGREAEWPSAVRAAESAVPVLILQQVVTVVLLHIVSVLSHNVHKFTLDVTYVQKRCTTGDQGMLLFGILVYL